MQLKVITSNPGKVAEFNKVFSSLGIEAVHLKHPYDEVQTFDLEEVVSKGMEEIRKDGIRDFIIDDSGLFIDALKGFPGVWSAFAQKTIGNDGILKLMDGVEDRRATFKCCIGCDIGGETMIVTGECHGTILKRSQGDGGFGYDPIFSYDGTLSFAEIPIDEKNKVSHRGNAVKLLVEKLREKGFAE